MSETWVLRGSWKSHVMLAGLFSLLLVVFFVASVFSLGDPWPLLPVAWNLFTLVLGVASVVWARSSSPVGAFRRKAAAVLLGAVVLGVLLAGLADVTVLAFLQV